MNEENIIARIFRFDPTTDRVPRFQTYHVPYQPGMSILSLLRYVYEELDPTIAFRNYRCGRGICASCRVRLNGKPVKACRTTLDERAMVTIEPLDEHRVIRDLAVAV